MLKEISNQPNIPNYSCLKERCLVQNMYANNHWQICSHWKKSEWFTLKTMLEEWLSKVNIDNIRQKCYNSYV